MGINLELYKVFYETARLGSVTAAAEALFLSQPAVSQQIKLLEQALDTRLFIRSSRGVRLTPEGRVLFAQVAPAYDAIRLGERKLAQMRNLESGELCIGASDMTLKFCLLPYLERFHSAHRGIHIRVTNAPTPDTLDSLAAGRIDFGVVSGPLPETPAFSARPVGQVRDVFVAGPRFDALRTQTFAPSDLARLPLICLEGPSSTRTGLERFFQAHGAELTPEFELATSDLIVEFALRNLGIGCVVGDFAREALAEGRLFALSLSSEPPPRALYLVQDERFPLSLAARQLIESIP